MNARHTICPTLGTLALGVALLTAPRPVLAEGYGVPPRPCAPAPCRRPPPPPGLRYGPPPAIVSGYLPRNNNLPMYNEPPARPPSW
ncbi:hypothetical protein [Methylobacterium radiodurans]|uniref:Uncharacterized protein n=1 Tax=Methylobacterium radiodurans TaxID=2202828 RepID=A0A2U8VPP3_9HYPH|nr:hypothetical protein [Methylobacterium radiodurans]AWN35659.1 hypothetical protein DK427_07820 [Methylobacterium radiodurans]